MASNMDDFMMGFLLVNTVGIIFLLVVFFTTNSKLKKIQEKINFIHQRAQRAKRAEELREDHETKRIEALKKRKKS